MSLLHAHPLTKSLIDLNGPEGNAYCLMGYANRIAQQIGVDPQPILADMRSSDYRHLVEVFDKHFGHVYDLVLPWNWEQNPVEASK